MKKQSEAKPTTKAYITLRDRRWKNKEWFTSFRSQKNIRKLTEEEATPLLKEGTIKEVELPTYQTNLVGVDKGRMFCTVCGSQKGFYIKKRPFGKAVQVFICAGCSKREIKKII